MRSIETLLASVDGEILYENIRKDQSISGVTIDSREVKKNFCFIAIKGYASDGHQYIEQAIEKGAALIVFQDGKYQENQCSFVQVKDSRKIASYIANNFYDAPSTQLQLIGVTGTNGKTSTVTLLHDLFHSLGFKVAKLTTIENVIDGKVLNTTHTTPGPVKLQALLSDCVEACCEYCFMEISSHSIDQDRIAAVKFSGAVFMNITHDHLDYHKTFINYLNAKKKFFDNLPKSAFALVNKDDKNGAVMLQNSKAKQLTFAMKSIADYKAKVLGHSFNGLHLQFNGSEFHTRLIGIFNVYNMLAAFGVAQQLGFESEEVLVAISNLMPAEGRFDVVVHANKVGIVDYAHTPDALLNVLKTIQQVAATSQNIITIVGCGGNRDATKRPIMAQIAAKNSDQVILTSDNPRMEDPYEIINQMELGIEYEDKSKVISIENRKQAIRTAVRLAKINDVILVAGKGHEKYQEVKGVKTAFDDKKILFDALSEG